MKKQFLGRFRKTDPANIMNPENYNRHLEQVEEGDASAQESGYAWFRMMAEQGYANAQFITAMCLRDGIGTEPDGEQALEWLERSAAQGYHEAQFLLGVYHLHGGMDGVEEDEAEGLRLLELAVEQHDHEAEYFLGMHLLNLPGEGTDAEKRGFLLLQAAALSGVAKAEYELGRCLYFGVGTEANREEGFSWVSRAAEAGLADAQDFTGMCCIYGTGTETDETAGIQWLEKAAEQELPSGLFHLGDCYFQGLGGARISQRLAITWKRVQRPALRRHSLPWECSC